MLWLNFDGALKVDSASRPVGYTPTAPIAHDRLTVSDTANRVVWYVMNTDVGIPAGNELQDPEWTTNADYAAFIGKDETAKWDGFIISLSTKNYLKFNNDKLTGIATPHAWIKGGSAPAASITTGTYDADGMISKDAVTTFFGTDSVKIVFSLRGAASIQTYDLYFIDYSRTTPVLQKLKKPADWTDDKAESALISPDGKWITYHCWRNHSEKDSYVQLLDTAAVPIKVNGDDENAFDPHWWRSADGAENYLVYCDITDGDPVTYDYLKFPTGVGKTYMQRVALRPDAVSSIRLFEKIGDPVEISQFPFKGGLSPDALFLCTGYQFAFMQKL